MDNIAAEIQRLNQTLHEIKQLLESKKSEKKHENPLGLKCKKCGSKDVNVAYHENQYGCSYSSPEKPEHEHLHVSCKLCWFDWTIPTKDNE